MKRLVISFLAVAVFFNCYRSQIPPDKVMHFGAGFIISFGTYKITEERPQAFSIAFIAGAGLGAAKEGIDYLGYGKPSLNDFKATAGGALAAIVCYKVILNFKARKKGNYEAWKGTDYEINERRKIDSLEIVRYRWRPPRDSI